MGGQTPDFFRARLDAMIDLRHPLAILSTRLPWKDIEAALAPSLTKAVREYTLPSSTDLLGVTGGLVVVAGVSPAGRPGCRSGSCVRSGI
jgi:IS5 family transposase